MMSRRVVISLAASLTAAGVVGVGGCKVDQDQEVQTYRKVVDLTPSTSQPAATQPATRPISQLTLREALYLANQQNERLSIEGENYLQSIINRKRAVAAFLPTANLSATYAAGESVPATPNTTFDAYATGNINLFNGFRDVEKLKIADLTIEQKWLVLRDLQESLLADTVRAYCAVLRAERQVEVLRNTVELQDARVRDMVARQEAGTARPLDVAQFQAQAAQTRVGLIAAEGTVHDSRAALAFLTNSPIEQTLLEDIATYPTQSLRPLAQMTDVALSQRNDLQAAHKAREAARHGVSAAVDEYYPSLSMNVTGFLYRETAPSDRDWLSIFQANMPIFSAGQIEADVRQAWSQYRQATLFETLLTRQIRQDVSVAWNNVQISRSRLRELRIQVAAAQQAVTQAEGSFQAGLATNLERLTAQDQLLSARLQEASELYNQRVNGADLLRAIGGLRERLEARTYPATAPTTAPATQPITIEVW